MATMNTNQGFVLEKEYVPQEAPPGYYHPANNQQYVGQPPSYQGSNGHPPNQMQMGQVPSYMPQYNQQYTSMTNVINSQPVPQAIIVQTAYVQRPSSYMCLSCCIFWFCNPLFGFIAFIFSLMSHSAYDEGNVVAARSRGRIALAMSITGVVFTVTLIAVLLAVAFSVDYND